jgi:hypothetical protein
MRARAALVANPFQVPRARRRVDTLRLKSIQIPDRTLELLESFAWSNQRVSPGAHRLHGLSELPPQLSRHVGSGPGQQYVWYGWTTGIRTWLLTGALSLERSRERGHPVLEVRSYDEHGYLEEAAVYVRARSDQWEQVDM